MTINAKSLTKKKALIEFATLLNPEHNYFIEKIGKTLDILPDNHGAYAYKNQIFVERYLFKSVKKIFWIRYILP